MCKGEHGFPEHLWQSSLSVSLRSLVSDSLLNSYKLEWFNLRRIHPIQTDYTEGFQTGTPKGSKWGDHYYRICYRVFLQWMSPKSSFNNSIYVTSAQMRYLYCIRSSFIQFYVQLLLLSLHVATTDVFCSEDAHLSSKHPRQRATSVWWRCHISQSFLTG